MLQKLEDDGFGTIDTDLFWEKLPLGKHGVAIFARGGELVAGRNRAVQIFDLYSRGTSDLLGADKLEKIWQFMIENYVICDLPIVPGKSNKQYISVQVTPTGNVENLGMDENDRVIFRLAAQVRYKKEGL
jgi:hypothetical protein